MEGKGYTGSQGAILRILGKGIFSYKIYFLIRCLFVALHEVAVEFHVLSPLLNARNQKAPIQS